MRRLAAVFLMFILAGCANSSTTFSNTFIKPLQPITEMRVLYIENELAPPGEKGAGERIPQPVSDTGYMDLPELLRERVPKVFKLNNINAKYETFKREKFGRDEQIQAVNWSAEGSSYPSLLILDVPGISFISGGGRAPTDFVKINANLFGSENKSRIWTGQFTSQFVQSLITYNGFDNKSTDRLLKTILEQMDKDGIIRLTNGKAILPDKEN